MIRYIVGTGSASAIGALTYEVHPATPLIVALVFGLVTLWSIKRTREQHRRRQSIRGRIRTESGHYRMTG